ncbi:MAG: hypothetical protein SFU98_07545 [Leptospiraceae bacterium]|nr:hypothetical protein [Leptospiraceae bacterium]
METTYNEQILTESFKRSVIDGVNNFKPINLQTYVLGDKGEAKLKFILNQILEKINKVELMELLYTSAKELIVNSTKASIKRLIFEENGVDLTKEISDSMMEKFKDSLTDKKFPYFRKLMKEKGYKVNIKFYFDSSKFILKIINNFPLLQGEEVRIRQKFVQAKKYDNLFEYYMDHSDHTEGAGMGITLVEILLVQSGYDRHLFTIYSKNGSSGETIAKLEIPINGNYKPKRFIFEDLLNQGIDLDKLRGEFKHNE